MTQPLLFNTQIRDPVVQIKRSPHTLKFEPESPDKVIFAYLAFLCAEKI